MSEELLTVEQPSLDRYVSATPTKYFFIAMLVKDIALEDAVIDLVDNSVDAAHKAFSGNLGAAEINIVMSNTIFAIRDNCGGMSLKTAQEEAFRIGREEVDFHDYDQSIGQFGVGLKRAIFKFGAEGSVTSRTVADCFEVKVNRDEWLKDHVWGFPFHSLEADPTKPAGVSVEVGQLNARVAEDFGNDAVIDDLKVKIRRAHYDALLRGIRISVNDQPLDPIDLSQYEFEGIRSISREIQSKKADGVKIFIQAGISGRDPRKAGWYVMCGNRMVLSADQSSVTGWGDVSSTGTTPRYHNQFSRFRGIVRFEADDQSKLPWNTTKRGVDTSSSLYQEARVYMVDALKDVVRFLNALDREYDADERPLQATLERADASPSASVSINQLKPADRFEFPRVPRVSDQSTITFKADKLKVQALKDKIDKQTLPDVGSYCFDFTYRRVVGENP